MGTVWRGRSVFFIIIRSRLLMNWHWARHLRAGRESTRRPERVSNLGRGLPGTHGWWLRDARRMHQGRLPDPGCARSQSAGQGGPAPIDASEWHQHATCSLKRRMPTVRRRVAPTTSTPVPRSVVTSVPVARSVTSARKRTGGRSSSISAPIPTRRSRTARRITSSARIATSLPRSREGSRSARLPILLASRSGPSGQSGTDLGSQAERH